MGQRGDRKQGATGGARGRDRGPGLALSLVVAAASFLAFWPAIHAGFSDFDDHGFLLEVTGWRGLAPENLTWISRTMRLGHYQPLTYLSYAVEYTLFGLDARAYHATNMLLHAANAVLVLWLCARVASIARPGVPRRAALWAGAAAALLWGVHPLRVETVAWITERRDVLSTLFLLAAAHAYLGSVRPGEPGIVSQRAYTWSVAFLLLSLLAKAWGITFVAAALVLDWYPLRRVGAGSPRHRDWGVVAQKWPFAALGIVFAVVAAIAQKTGSPDTMKTLSQWGLAERGAQACYGLVFYVWKTIAPARLAALYELPESIDWKDAEWAVSIGGVCVAGIALSVLALRGRARAWVAAALLYAVVLSPVLGIAQSGIQLVADRYAYVGTIPLFVLLAGGLVVAGERLGARRARVLLGAGGVLAYVLGVLAWRQAALWADARRLWEHALAVGQEGPILRNMYARQLEKAKDPRAAIEQYRLSLGMKPDYADSWYGIGTSLKALGDYAGAEEAFLRSAKLDEDPTKDFLALGLLYIQHLNRPRDAVEAFTQAVDSTRAHGNPAGIGTPFLMLAGAYDAVGDYAQEERWLREAARYEDTRAQALDLLQDFQRR